MNKKKSKIDAIPIDNHGKRIKHKPCKRRKREARDGVEMDWCYAIGCEKVGDMPCEYCADRRK